MSRYSLIRLSLAYSTSFSVYAESLATGGRSSAIVSSSDVVQWLLALVLVLAIFGGLVWLLRKSGTGLSFSAKSQLAIVGGLSLGMRERLVLIRVGEKQLLLGVTPGRIDKLLELDGEQRLFQSRESDGDSASFAHKLQQLMRANGDG